MGSFKKAQAGRTKTGRMDYRFLLECRKVEIAYGFQPFERGAEFDPGKYPFSTTKRLRDRFQRSVGYPFRTELDFDELGNLSSEDASMLALDRIQWDMIRHTTDDGIPLLFLPISAKVDRDRLRGLKKGGKIQVYGRLYGAIRDGNPVPALIVDAVEFDAPKVEVNEDGYIVITKRELVKGYEARHEKKYQVHFVYRGIGSIPAKIKKEVPFLQKYEGKLLRSEHNDLEGLGNEPPVVVIMPDAGDKDLAVLAKAEPGDTLVMNCHVYAKDGKRLLFVKDFELPPIRPGGE
jgi:hypothetical protein